MQDARKLKKDQEMAWAPPRNKSDRPDWEEGRSAEKARGELSQTEKTEVPEIIIVSDAVESTYVGLDGKNPSRAGRRNKFQKRKRSTRRTGC